jgi:hypothetical protein
MELIFLKQSDRFRQDQVLCSRYPRCTQPCASESRKVIEAPQLPKTPFGIRFARSCNARFCLARGLEASVRSPLQRGANSGR